MPGSSALIAVTGECDRRTGLWQPREAYLKAVEDAGGSPFAIQAPQELDGLDGAAGLLLTGGGDVAPRRYGRPVHPALGPVDEERDELELALVAEAMERDLPILAICRGMQVMVVACGGSLWQDLPSELPHSVGHGRGAGRSAGTSKRASHSVTLSPGTLAANACGVMEFEVNSSHHQAAQLIGGGLVISGWAPDGIAEAVELPGARFVLGVQWHPEDMLGRAEQARVFSVFIAAARG